MVDRAEHGDRSAFLARVTDEQLALAGLEAGLDCDRAHGEALAAAWATVSRSTNPFSSSATSPDRLRTSKLGSVGGIELGQERPRDAFVEDVQGKEAGAAELRARLGLGRCELVDAGSGDDERDDDDLVLSQRPVDGDREPGRRDDGVQDGLRLRLRRCGLLRLGVRRARRHLGRLGCRLAGALGCAFRTGCGIGADSSTLGPSVRMASMPAKPARTIRIAKIRTGRLIFSISLLIGSGSAVL